eukprot:jgi/Phyca11/122886/e_gw1.49.300.1
MFYSDTATVEKARDFWELFEAHTGQLPDRERLLVFRQKLKGREAERWWGNSRIKTFATLKVRFHNQFLSRTTDELWERNKRMQAALDSSPARDIPEACEWLMFKEMHRPAEEDDDFSDGQPSRFNGNGRTRGIKMAADTRTQEGEPVCGRCDYRGHSREACMRRTMTCRRCGQLGHIVVECEQPWNGGQATAPSLKCYFCGEAGHAVSRCPTITALKGLATSAASGTPTTPRN